jgi:hypothetical protein
MTLEYDNDGNVLSDKYSPSPLSRFMNQDFDEEETVQEEKRPVIKDPEAMAALPLFRTLSLRDLENLKDPEWIVEGILPADAMVTIYGPPGSTKSFWALHVACSIASGKDFNNTEKVKKGKVIYCIGEGLRGFKLRIEAWKLANPDADLEALDNNLIIIPRAVMLLDKMEAGMLVNTAEMINEDKDLRAFIIDTWARSITGGDENSAKDAGIAINVCETVRAKTGASPIIVHHTGADGQRERGSTALRGATDTTILMEYDTSTQLTTVSCKKMKDGEPFKPIKYELKPFGHSVVMSPTLAGNYNVGYNPQVRDKAYWAKKAIENRDNPWI